MKDRPDDWENPHSWKMSNNTEKYFAFEAGADALIAADQCRVWRR